MHVEKARSILKMEPYLFVALQYSSQMLLLMVVSASYVVMSEDAQAEILRLKRKLMTLKIV
jgi:hypothetical protein